MAGRLAVEADWPGLFTRVAVAAARHNKRRQTGSNITTTTLTRITLPEPN
jgi:hypothetical protein